MPINDAEITALSAHEAASLIRSRDLSSERLVRACLKRIEQRESAVAAWQYLDQQYAIDQARMRDRSDPVGPLHGVPVGVKDLIDTADMPTTYGSSIYAEHRPDRDATCVSLLRAAGAVILGKTVTTEFALFQPGKTANPHDPSRTPGGSSSGSAAAVADKMVPLALGTQTAGSLIRPASFCGTFAFKPTFGSIDRTGVKPLSNRLDTLGYFARAPEDLTLMKQVLSKGTLCRSTTDGTTDADKSQKPLRVAFCRSPHWAEADRSTRDRIETAIDQIREFDPIEELKLPAPFAQLTTAQEVVQNYEAARSLSNEFRNHRDQLSPGLAQLIDRGRALNEHDLTEALNTANNCRRLLDSVAEDVDFFITPAVVGEPPPREAGTGDPLFCRAWTLLGTPTVAVPGLTAPPGLPLGLQVVAPLQHDGVALRGASWLHDRLKHARGSAGTTGAGTQRETPD